MKYSREDFYVLNYSSVFFRQFPRKLYTST